MDIGRLIYRFQLSIFFLLFLNGSVAAKTSFQPAKAGVLDLRNHTISENINLNGEWLFYWNQLIGDYKVESKQGKGVIMPMLWTKPDKNGISYPAFGYATYKLTIFLPKTKSVLRLSMPRANTAYRLIINGDLVAANGRVGRSKAETKPEWVNKNIDLKPNVDTLHILLQISNFSHSKGGINMPILLGTKEFSMRERIRTDTIDLLLTGCLLMGGLFFLGLYCFGNKDKAILLFALFALVYSYRMIGANNYIFPNLFPGMNWYVAIRLQYISVFAGIGLFGLYSRYLYPEDINKSLVYVVTALCLLCTGITIFSDPVIFTRIMSPFLFVAAFCLVYVLYLYVLAYIYKRPGSIYALCSAISLLFVSVISLLQFWDIIPRVQVLSFVGYILFFFLQSLVL
jgi:hypothetical protein